MNLETGKIKKYSKDELNQLEQLKQKLIEIEEKDMTEKQKKNMQVSLKDHRSKLGKKLTEERKKRGYSQMTRNQRRNLRHRLKGKS